MRCRPKIFAVMIFVVVTSLTFIAGVSAADKAGQMTNSGLLGICGPYGEHANLVILIFVGSLPVAIVAGVFSARYCYRRVRNAHKTWHTATAQGRHRASVYNTFPIKLQNQRVIDEHQTRR